MLEEVDLEQLDEQFKELGPSLKRLATYRGVARELGGAVFNLALWPVGLAQDLAAAGFSRIPWPTRNGKKHPAHTTPTSDAAAVPIVLVHGYFHNRSGFMVMRRALRRHGFQHVNAFTYNPLRKGIPELAGEVATRVECLLEETGSSRVHLVGHSLGGLIARYYVEQMGGHRNVHTVVTLGTPHQGTAAAFFARSQTARQMRPGSEFIKRLSKTEKPNSVRYLSYYSNLDMLVVPTHSALLECENGNARNIRVRDLGHLSLLLSQELIESISDNLSEI